MVKIDFKDGIKRIILSQPEKKNPLSIDIVRVLRDEFKKVEDEVDVIVFTGEGNSFCSGADLSGGGVEQSSDLQTLLEKYVILFHELILSIITNPKPTVARIAGPAVGFGADLAMWFDFKIISKSAYIAEIFPKRAILPDGGGVFLITHMLGPTYSFKIFSFGDKISGEEAERLGIVSKCVDDEKIDEEVFVLCEKLKNVPKNYFAKLKKMIWESLMGTFETHLKYVRILQPQQFQTAEFREGISSFFLKKEPNFKDIKLKMNYEK